LTLQKVLEYLTAKNCIETSTLYTLMIAIN